jgi:hypothetical protein
MKTMKLESLPELDWSEGVPGTGVQRHRASTPHREIGLDGVVLNMKKKIRRKNGK